MALFSFALLVVAGFWTVVPLGGLGVDALDADADTGAGVDGEGADDLLGGAGLGGVPATVALSLLIALGWFASLVGSVLVRSAGGAAVHALLAVVVLLAASAVAWLGTQALVPPLRRVFQPAAAPSRRDFVGLVCVVRTGHVGPHFGQAEVTAAGTGRTAGSTALIFDGCHHHRSRSAGR